MARTARSLPRGPLGLAAEPDAGDGPDAEPLDPASLIGDGGDGSGGAGPGSDSGDGNGTDADAPFGRFPDGRPRKRRGRGSGGTGGAPRSSAKTASANLGVISSTLMSAHMMAAMFLKSPELALEQKEADALAGAISEVEKFYSVSLSPETRAWLGLATVGAMVYGPRAYTIYHRRKAERKSNGPAAPSLPVVSKPKEVSGASTTEGGPPPATMSAADFGFG